MPVPPAVSPDQWDLLVWYAVAIHDDGRKAPPFKTMARCASITPQAARVSWNDGLPHLGQPSLKVVRSEVTSGARPFPSKPEGAPEGTSRLASKAARQPKVPPPAPPPAPRAPRLPAPTPDDGDPWGGEGPPDDVATALGQVPFPGEAEAPLPTFKPRVIPQVAGAAGRQAQRDAAGDRLDPTAQREVDAGEREADAPFDPATAVDDTPPLPSEVARSTGQALAPIDKEVGERALLESRLDAIDIAGRARTAATLGVYATQLLMSGAVPLARRTRYEMIQLARTPAVDGAPFDVEKALSLLQRATQVTRSVSTVATNAMAISRGLTEDLRTHLKALDAVSPTVGAGGEAVPGSDEDLLREMEHEQGRLARDHARLARKMKGEEGPGPEGGGDAPVPAVDAEPAAPEAPPPVPLETVLTRETLAELGDVDTQARGREYLADRRVDGLSREGEAISAVVHGSEPYNTRIEVAEGALAHDCTCPQGQIGRVCKHVVALGLAWLGSRPTQGG